MIAAPPQRFSTVDGTIQGVIDGTNTVFSTAVLLKRAQVYWNGLLMTINFDLKFVFVQRSLIFFPPYIPQPGDVLTIQGWL